MPKDDATLSAASVGSTAVGLTPYYQRDGITIYHGDCREIAPRLDQADLMLTDPPYGTSRYHDGVDGFDFLDLAWGKEVAVFGWPEKLCEFVATTGRPPNEWITWWAMNAGQKGFNLSGLWKETEAIAFWGNPKPFAKLKRPRGSDSRFAQKMRQQGVSDARGLKLDQITQGEARLGDVWLDSSPGLGCNAHIRNHPNEKPVSIVARIIAATTPETVLDPFMGSGTTLVAARAEGRRAVGIEIEERYCEIAAKRLSQGVLF